MSFGVEDIIIQTHEIWLGEDEVEVLQRLGHPEGLLRVVLEAFWIRNVAEGGIRILGLCQLRDGFKHAPGVVLVIGVARHAVKIEDGFDCFGSGVLVSRSIYGLEMVLTEECIGDLSS